MGSQWWDGPRPETTGCGQWSPPTRRPLSSGPVPSESVRGGCHRPTARGRPLHLTRLEVRAQDAVRDHAPAPGALVVEVVDLEGATFSPTAYVASSLYGVVRNRAARRRATVKLIGTIRGARPASRTRRDRRQSVTRSSRHSAALSSAYPSMPPSCLGLRPPRERSATSAGAARPRGPGTRCAGRLRADRRRASRPVSSSTFSVVFILRWKLPGSIGCPHTTS